MILGEEYYRGSNWLSADDSSSEDGWYTWVREDTSGIVLGAFGDTNIVDSATIFDPPIPWFPNGVVNVGYAWDFDAPDLGGHFFFEIGSITDTVEVPAGIFNDCIRIYGLLVDSSGDSTQFSLYHYAPGIGEVSNNTYNVSGWYAILELKEYSVLTHVEKDRITEIPAKFHMQQNYPNPFNPTTRIEYTLLSPGKVSLIIYNILGEEVTRLVDGEMLAGEHTAMWNASIFSSGIYFYRLRAGDFIRTRKMVLLK